MRFSVREAIHSSALPASPCGLNIPYTRFLARTAIQARALLCCGLAFILISLTSSPGQCFPWSQDMFYGPKIGAEKRTPRNVPSGILGEHQPTPLSRNQAATQLRNPLSPTPKRLNKGHELFLTTCAPCHGRSGQGDGPVRFLLRVAPADLMSGKPVKASDGLIFSIIRDGDITMPPYGDTLSVEDTWELILYLRQMQRESSSQASTR
ncbi:MAG: c-type cytochrome [Candidatus Binataceae bacterium]